MLYIAGLTKTPKTSSFNHNPLRMVRNRLGDHDTQDSILEVGLDSILVHAGGEAKSTMEFPHRALGDPILGPILLTFAAFRSFADLFSFPRSTGTFGPFIFNASFVASMVRHFARDATGRRDP